MFSLLPESGRFRLIAGANKLSAGTFWIRFTVGLRLSFTSLMPLFASCIFTDPLLLEVLRILSLDFLSLFGGREASLLWTRRASG